MSLSARGIDVKIGKHRVICSEFQQRAEEVLVDMQGYTFAVARTYCISFFLRRRLCQRETTCLACAGVRILSYNV